MRGEVLMLILIYPQVAPCSLLVVVVAVDSTVVVVVDIVVVVVSIVVAVVLLVVAVVLLVVVVEVKLDVVAMVCVVARSVVAVAVFHLLHPSHYFPVQLSSAASSFSPLAAVAIPGVVSPAQRSPVFPTSAALASRNSR